MHDRPLATTWLMPQRGGTVVGASDVIGVVSVGVIGLGDVRLGSVIGEPGIVLGMPSAAAPGVLRVSPGIGLGPAGGVMPGVIGVEGPIPSCIDRRGIVP